MLLHPALLDSALPGLFVAYCWPDDGSLDQLHVSTEIKSFRVNVGLYKQNLVPESDVMSCSQLTGNPLATRQLNEDVDIYANDGTGLVHMEGIKVATFAEATAEADRAMFAEHAWGVLSPNCELTMGGARATAEDHEFTYGMEKVSINYMKQLVTLFPESDRRALNLEWHFVCLLEFFSNLLSTVQGGTRQCAQTPQLMWQVPKPSKSAFDLGVANLPLRGC